ncbi:AEC family transporter [Lachnoclostridium sp. Marseille-P6806]|uniref:AEC family transporter n=1 Tax=Lachnoclostridium sp. Marseille-P6806 TaxID=2364793 RepID=UPI00102FF3B9|nr:AEC family transporter [Lachnoclostridium sp. Marseille-P6806]
MIAVIEFAFNAIAPLIVLILLGYCGRKSGMLSPGTLTQTNKFVYRFGFFAIMFKNIYDMDLDAPVPWIFFLLLVFSYLVLTAAGVFLADRITAVKGRKPVLIQAMFRSNYAVIGLALAESLAGGEGLALASICQIPAILYYNIVSTVILSLYHGASESGVNFSAKRLAGDLLSNPLIQGISAGLTIVLARKAFPCFSGENPLFTIRNNMTWLYASISYLARLTTPMALIILGGQLERSEAGGFRRELISGVVMRLIGAPAVGLSIALTASYALHLYTLTPAMTGVLVAAFGSPMAVSSAVMSAEMGADGKLCSQIIVWTSILSMGSLFFIIMLLRSAGML